LATVPIGPDQTKPTVAPYGPDEPSDQEAFQKAFQQVVFSIALPIVMNHISDMKRALKG
jgi:hypothetical protein